MDIWGKVAADGGESKWHSNRNIATVSKSNMTNQHILGVWKS